MQINLLSLLIRIFFTFRQLSPNGLSVFSQVDVQYTTYSLQLNIDIVSFRRSYYILSSATFTSTKFFMSFTLVVFLLLKEIHPNCYYMNDYLLYEMKYKNEYPMKRYIKGFDKICILLAKWAYQYTVPCICISVMQGHKFLQINTNLDHISWCLWTFHD